MVAIVTFCKSLQKTYKKKWISRSRNERGGAGSTILSLRSPTGRLCSYYFKFTSYQLWIWSNGHLQSNQIPSLDSPKLCVCASVLSLYFNMNTKANDNPLRIPIPLRRRCCFHSFPTIIIRGPFTHYVNQILVISDPRPVVYWLRNIWLTPLNFKTYFEIFF